MTSARAIDWPTLPLGGLLADVQPGFASGKHNSIGEGIPHFRPMNVSTDGHIERTVLKYVDPAAGRQDLRLRQGDVVFNNTNSPELVGKTALFEDDDAPAFSNHMTRLRTDPERLDPGYLALRLHQAWREGWFAEHCNNHVSQASIGRDVLRRFEIEVPPIELQRAIYALHHRIYASQTSSSAHLDTARRAIVRFRQAVLAAACSGRLTADWRESHSPRAASDVLAEMREASIGRSNRRAIINLQVEDLDDLPASWAWAAIGEVGDVQLGGTPSRKIATYWGGRIPWVSSGEVANCRISTTRETISQLGLDNSNAKLYPAGTVLIAMIGEGKTRGQSAILDIEASTNQNAAGILPDTRVVSSEYIWRWALAQYEVTRAVGRGGNQPALNGQKVRELAIPIPPVEEQSEIVRRVDELLALADDLRERLNSAHSHVERIAQSFLAQALRGELVHVGIAPAENVAQSSGDDD